MNKNIQKLLEVIDGKKSVGEQFYEASKAKKIVSKKSFDSVPKSWETIHYKTYPRFRAFTIKEEKGAKTPLQKIINRRHSIRDFTGEAVPFDDFFSLMQQSAGIIDQGNSFNESKRVYPSAGARYPLELYAIVLNVSDFKKGLYHYSVKENLVEFLYDKKISNEIKDVFGDELWIMKASVIFFITGIHERTSIKYGDRGHRFMYIETGLLAQNLLLLATEKGYATCLVGGFIEDKVIEFFDIHMQGEYPLLAIALGKIVNK